MNIEFQDYDYIQDGLKNFYRVVGNTHLPDRVFCQLMFNPHDPHKNLPFPFASIPPEYHKLPHCKYSDIFGTNVFQVRRQSIKKHWKPQVELKQLWEKFQKQESQRISLISKSETTLIECAISLSNYFNIPIKDLGITNNYLGLQSKNKTKFHFTIYGKPAIRNIYQKYRQIQEDLNSDLLQPWLKIELLPYAKKIAQEIQRPLEEPFEILYNQPIRFHYRHYDLILHFIPKPEEVLKNPAFTLETRVKFIQHLTLEGEIIDHQWNDYFPGVLYIKPYRIISEHDFKLNNFQKINRILILNPDFLHAFKQGDIIQVRGKLQDVVKIPSHNTLDLINVKQITVGLNDNPQNVSYIIRKLEMKTNHDS